MAIPVQQWFVDSVSWTAMTAWSALTAKTVGQMVRQNSAPTVNNERVFICIIAGTTLASEPTWVVSKGAKTAEAAGPTWMEVTGQAALCGNLAAVANWTTVKNQAVAIGFIIQRNNGASYQICTTAGTTGNGSEPSFSDTAGTTTADNTVTWTSLGVVGNYTTAFKAASARLNPIVNSGGWAQDGDTVFVGDDHAETQASSMNLFNISNSSLFIYCVDHTKTAPGSGDLKTTATVSTTGNNNMLIGNVTGGQWQKIYIYGITFSNGSTGSHTMRVGAGQSNFFFIFENCELSIVGTTGASINFGLVTGAGTVATANAGLIVLNNTKLKFSEADLFCQLSCHLIWKNTATAIDAGGSVPTILFSPNVSNNIGLAFIECTGVDLSAMGSGTTIIGASTLQGGLAVLSDCKLGSSVTVSSAPAAPGSGFRTDLIRCDSGATNYRQERYWYEGTLTTETTIVRTGGASDGTTPISWKIVSTANPLWLYPFQAFPIGIWNTVVGSSVTATIQIINNGVTLKNDDVWAEVEYLGSSSTPQGSFANNTKANNLATGSNLTTSTAGWTTTGLGSPIKQALAVTFTPQMAGYIRVTVMVAKVSQTVYIDPLVVLS